MKYSIGKARPIIIKSPSGGDDGAGGSEEGFTNNISAFACVRQKKGSRVLSHEQTSIEKVFEFVIRWRTGIEITSNNVIEYNGKDHSILNVEVEEEKERYWIIEASQIVN